MVLKKLKELLSYEDFKKIEGNLSWKGLKK